MLQCLAWFVFITANPSVWAAENTSLSSSTELSNEGYFVLSWPSDITTDNLVLEQSSNQDFSSTIERSLAGATAATITGLSDGVYYFRLTESDNPISNTVSVTVAHHSLARAGSFFLLGLALFSLLIISILRGNRRAGI